MPHSEGPRQQSLRKSPARPTLSVKAHPSLVVLEASFQPGLYIVTVLDDVDVVDVVEDVEDVVDVVDVVEDVEEVVVDVVTVDDVEEVVVDVDVVVVVRRTLQSAPFHCLVQLHMHPLTVLPPISVPPFLQAEARQLQAVCGPLPEGTPTCWDGHCLHCVEPRAS